MTFMTWRQQACLVMALPRLAAGETVTSVAMALGYDNPAAFTAMFQRTLGRPRAPIFAMGETKPALAQKEAKASTSARRSDAIRKRRPRSLPALAVPLS